MFFPPACSYLHLQALCCVLLTTTLDLFLLHGCFHIILDQLFPMSPWYPSKQVLENVFSWRFVSVYGINQMSLAIRVGWFSCSLCYPLCTSLCLLWRPLGSIGSQYSTTLHSLKSHGHKMFGKILCWNIPGASCWHPLTSPSSPRHS